MEQAFGIVVSFLLAILLMLVGWMLKTLGSIVENQESITKMTKDLHEWHRPDGSGRQTWKDTGPVLEKFDGVMDRLDRLCELLEKVLDNQPQRGRRST